MSSTALGSDPYIFVPSIQHGDIPDLEKTPGEGGLVAADEELIKAHEFYQLPVEATFDDLQQN